MGLIGRWRLDERQPNGYYYDVTPYDNEGIAASLPGGTKPTMEPTVPAPDGTCAGFDGTGFIVVPRGGVDHWILEPRDQVSVEACALADESPGAYRYIVSKGADADRRASYGLYTGRDGGLQFYVSNDQGLVALTQPSVDPWDGAWHHLAGTFRAGKLALWVDGQQIATATAPFSVIAYGLSPHNDLIVGNYLTSADANGRSGFGFVGKIDEVRIWDGLLSFT
jgi:hypothetical protein